MFCVLTTSNVLYLVTRDAFSPRWVIQWGEGAYKLAVLQRLVLISRFSMPCRLDN